MTGVQTCALPISSSVTYVTPVVAVIAGILFLGEKLTWNEPVGALVVLFGAAIAQERIKLFGLRLPNAPRQNQN